MVIGKANYIVKVLRVPEAHPQLKIIGVPPPPPARGHEKEGCFFSETKMDKQASNKNFRQEMSCSAGVEAKLHAEAFLS